MYPTKPPFVLRKSHIGLVGIYVIGAASLFTLTLVGAWLLRLTAMLATWVSSFIYKETRVVIGSDGISVDSWSNLLRERTDLVELRHINNISVSRSGILSLLFGVGTLRTETVAGEPNLRTTYIAEPERWRRDLSQTSCIGSTTQCMNTKPSALEHMAFEALCPGAENKTAAQA